MRKPLRLEKLEDRRLMDAQALVVTTVDDVVDPDDGLVSLREAISTANESDVVAGQRDVITFAADLGGTISLDQGQLQITDAVELLGNGSESNIIDAGGESRVFHITDGDFDVMFAAVTITGGFVEDERGASIFAETSGTVTLQDSRLVDGRIVSDELDATAGIDGRVRTTVRLIRSELSGHHGSAAFADTLIVQHSHILDNSSSGLTGWEITVVDSVIGNNLGGGIRGYGQLVRVENSTIHNNSSIEGAGIAIYNSAPLQLISSSISSNTANERGGGIFNRYGWMSIVNSTISSNRVSGLGSDLLGVGGGIATDADYDLRLFNSTITQNVAAIGGGIYRTGENNRVVIHNSVIANNTADDRNRDVHLTWYDAPDDSQDHIDVRSSFIGDASGSGLIVSPTGDADGNRIGSEEEPLDPKLVPIPNRNAQTLLWLPAEDSVLVDTGNNELVEYVVDPFDPAESQIEYDQRGFGFQRIAAGKSDSDLPTVDIGALEFLAVPNYIVGVELNGDQIDADDLNELSQPTDWSTQRSQIQSISIETAKSLPNVRPVDVRVTHFPLNLSESGQPSTGQAVPLTQTQISIDPDQHTLHLHFGDAPLGDGRLEIALTPGVTGAQSVTVGREDGNRLYVLAGDFDGDGSLTTNDLGVLSYWMNQSSAVAPRYVNINGDEVVDIADASVFQGNRLKQIAYPGQPQVPSMTAAEVDQAFASLADPLDVSGDGQITALDALQVINALSRIGDSDSFEWATDTNRDRNTTALDALLIINRLASISSQATVESERTAGYGHATPSVPNGFESASRQRIVEPGQLEPLKLAAWSPEPHKDDSRRFLPSPLQQTQRR
ncbi:MAG: dockerin type I domain-containing protein [Rubripirellula sp.]